MYVYKGRAGKLVQRMRNTKREWDKLQEGNKNKNMKNRNNKKERSIRTSQEKEPKIKNNSNKVNKNISNK